MTPFKLFFGLAVMALTFTACVKDEIELDNQNLGLHPEFGVAIAQAHIEASRVIENFDEGGFVVTGDDGLLSLIYRDTLTEFTADDLLDFPGQQYETEMDLSDLELVSGTNFGAITITQEEMYSFNSPEGDRLDSIRFASGDFRLNLTSTGDYPVNGSLRVLGENDVLLLMATFNDQNAPIEVTTNEDMEGVLFLPINNDNIINGLKFVFELTFSDEATGSPGEMDIAIDISDFSILHVGGYIAPRNYTIDNQSVNINLFDQETLGQVTIADPRLHLYFDNGFGVGLGIQIDELTGTNVNGQSLVIPNNQIDDFPEIGAAAFLGDVVNSTVTITNDNITPTLTEFMLFEPNNVNANLSLAVNPSDEESVFVSSESQLGISFEAEIPIYGSISDFQLIDTTDVSLGDFIKDANETSEVEALDLRLFVNNGLPIDAGVQIVFVDSIYNRLDSLFLAPDFVFTSAPVELGVLESDPTYGTAIGQTPTLTVVSISQDRIPNLENAVNMIIRVFGQTTSNGDHPIRLNEDDAFDLHLSAKTKLSF
jgi:hypothetical protein